MKNILQTLVILLAIASSAKAQTNLYTENFNGPTNTFTLNTNDQGCVGLAGYNQWIVNNSYAGGGITSFLCGFPIPVNLGPTPMQPAGITGFPTSNYMHISSVDAITSAVPNCNFLASDGGCNLDEYYFTRMTNDISTVGYSSVAFSFWWICEAEVGTCFGEVYYSTDGGLSWNVCTNPFQQYSTNSVWTQQTITDPNFDNQLTLRFGFMFTNTVATAPLDPPFGIDDINITGTGGTVGTITTLDPTPMNYCPGDSIQVIYTSSASFIAGNIMTAELSNSAGSFAAPVVIGTIPQTTTSGFIPAVIPGGTTPGILYRVRAKSSNPAITGSPNTQNITVNQAPIITTMSTTTPCGSSTGTATAIATGGSGNYSYSWNTTPVQTTSTATALSAGIYTVTVSDITSGCTSQASATVSTLGGLTATATSTATSCAGASDGTATANPTGGSGNYSYLWSGVPAQTTNPAVNLPAGTYTCTISDLTTGCTTIVTVVVQSGAAGSVAGTVSGPSSVCLLSSGVFTVTGSVGNLQWQSSPNGTVWNSILGATNPTFTSNPISTTIYFRVIVGGTFPCIGDTSNQIMVTVNPAPTSSFSVSIAGLNVTFNSSASIGASTFSWDFGDGGTSTSANPLHSYPSIGSYIVCLAVANAINCTDTTCTTINLNSDDVKDVVQHPVNIFPNPAANSITVESDWSLPAEVTLINISGQVVFMQDIQSTSSNSISFAIPSMASGMYWMRIKTEQWQTGKSILIQKN